MKKQITSAFALFTIAIILGTAQLVSAQTSERVVVNIPFDFVVGSRQLPAGRYTVSRVTRDSAKALFIRSEDGRTTATVLTNTSGRKARRTELAFRQYGDSFFLAAVSLPGASGGRAVPESKRERNLRRELAAKAGAGGHDGAAQTVTVVGTVQ